MVDFLRVRKQTGGPVNFHPKRTEGSCPFQGRIRTADGENFNKAGNSNSELIFFSCTPFFNFAETIGSQTLVVVVKI